MDIFDFLSLIGGLALFLFGMQLMGGALEKKAGGKLKTMLGKMTDSPIKGFLLGLGVTAIIQSSSATTVMVVGFVNSGIMTLHQAINIIIGANVGTTVTAWILSLAGIDSSNMWIKLLEPSSFTPVLALAGIILCMFFKNAKKKDTGTILLGFAVLMTGMSAMSGAVSGLRNDPAFTGVLTAFNNPVFGVLAGALLTAVIQSSSASVGILQALSSTGAITYNMAIPIIMGQNIGTCVTAMISSVGANKNAKRAAFVHLYFNIIGTTVWLVLFYCINLVVRFSFLSNHANGFGIAVVHTAFNILCTALLLPFTRILEKLAYLTVKDSKEPEEYQMLDERLLATPSVAIERSRKVALSMSALSVETVKKSFLMLTDYDNKKAEEIRQGEDKVDKYEDHIANYLVKLSSLSMNDDDSSESSRLLRIIGDFERISDHAVNVLESAEEMHSKNLSFSGEAKHELTVIINAVSEILDLSNAAFRNNDLDSSVMVEPLEQVVDYLKDYIKRQHIKRLQKNECTIELGFILSDIITDLERISDHCSNIAGYIIEMENSDVDIHEYMLNIKNGQYQEYNDYYEYYKTKYAI